MDPLYEDYLKELANTKKTSAWTSLEMKSGDQTLDNILKQLNLIDESSNTMYRDVTDDISTVKNGKSKVKLGYNQIQIQVVQNGFLAVDLHKQVFVFKDLDELNVWMKENMAPTGEGRKFLEKL